MKPTSVQNIKNVKDICVSAVAFPMMGTEESLTIVIYTDDDIFEFNFDGVDLVQKCKKAGLFSGWEKEQKIRELSEELSSWKKEAVECLRTRDKIRKENKDLKEENEKLRNELSLEKAANEAQHKFIRKYAGEDTEIEFHYTVGDDDVTYVIVDKEEYKALKNCDCKIRLHGMDFTRDELVNRILELEKLKTPTIENFADEKPSTRADILDQAKKCVCGQREQDYGTPESNFQLIADLWNGYLGGRTDNPVISVTPVDVSMMMTLMKIARIRNGGGSGDSFVDLAGYAACGGEIWHGQNHKDQK